MYSSTQKFNQDVRANLNSTDVLSLSDGDEEARWLREEQRWLREELRWLREEKRWNAEKEELQKEIKSLKSLIFSWTASRPDLFEQLKVSWEASGKAPDDLLEAELIHTKMGASGAIKSSPVLPQIDSEVTLRNSSEPVLQSNEEPAESVSATSQVLTEKPPKIRALGVGAEGEDVERLQTALGEYGFYCGEDDILNNFFSEDTESAVKTWQATIGAKENGVMTEELLNYLFGPSPLQKISGKATVVTPPKAVAHGTRAPKATKDIPEIERYARSSLEVGEGNEKRVYLLGENRWEEPRRLLSKGDAQNKKKGMTLAVSKCFTCRGEGTVTCSECEGTGDLNVEEQFLDWAGEDARCPYCEGTGAVECDTCDGARVAE